MRREQDGQRGASGGRIAWQQDAGAQHSASRQLGRDAEIIALLRSSATDDFDGLFQRVFHLPELEN